MNDPADRRGAGQAKPKVQGTPSEACYSRGLRQQEAYRGLALRDTLLRKTGG